MKTLREMLRLIRDQHRRLWFTIFLNTLMGLGALVPPFLLKAIIDNLISASRHPETASGQLRQIGWVLLGLAVLRLGLAAAGYIQERVSDLMRLDAIIDLRRRIFKHVLNLSVDYYETHKVGETVQRITQSVYEFGTWLQTVTESVSLNVLTVIFGVVVMWFVNPLAGLVVMVTVILKLWLALRKKHQSRSHRLVFRQRFEQVQGHITESVQNLTTLRVFGSEQDTYEAHSDMARELRLARLSQHFVEWRYNTGIQLVEGLGLVLALGAIVLSTLGGHSTPGNIVLVALLLQQVLSNLQPLATFIDRTGELISSCERMLELLAVKPTIVDKPEAQELESIEKIEFRNVDFTYPGHARVVLHDISFTLEPGEMLALVGPSGTGKTTIVKLLLRLYAPTGGQILINGRDVSEFTADSVRRHMGTVMQDVALFNDTFAANVRLAKPEATEAEFGRAVKLAHADEFVRKLPDGYGTLVGERGIKLSGGQKQRVAIARAILKKPHVVILDEATSALDSASERDVQAGLEELMRGRMAVVIAHRLSTIKRANRILVIKHGKIVEQGTHQALVDAEGPYAESFKMQSR